MDGVEVISNNLPVQLQGNLSSIRENNSVFFLKLNVGMGTVTLYLHLLQIFSS
ncbi:hypothetical protein EDE15_0132 [Edaphobacter aggregans]|uniref:Uncharacterized protein n=1 Tax=Edaphobacter aggregans TaxID=570835 RepID=A0A428MCY6_9BACT|nr:hypothetical protein EDE15_0132 [Edaphobacter aggregans]